MTLDPELAGLMHHVRDAGLVTELLDDPAGLQRLQALTTGVLPYQPPDVPVRAVDVPGPNGPVPVRIYGEPASDGSGGPSGTAGGGTPALVWMHGGGFTGGGLDMGEADQLAREVAARGRCLVVTVGYRLARDGVHFPVPHEDVVAAWLWTVDHAAAMGADPLRLCLGGAGVGGNLAVGAALYLEDSNRPVPSKVVLAYPFLHGELPADAVLDQGDSAASLTAGLPPILRYTADDRRAMVENYIGGPMTMASSYAMPGHADPAGLPPVAILACEHDDLRFSSELFADGLRVAGIPVEYRLEQGATHGYLNHSAGFRIVQKGLQFLVDEVISTKPFQ